MEPTADENLKDIFPFLKLSPEIRNRIYDYSLYHNRCEGITANVALLRVNKQIHHEAKEIIFGNGSFSMFFTCRSCQSPCFTAPHTRIVGDLSFKQDSYPVGLHAFAMKDVFPEQLLKMKHISLDLNIRWEKTSRPVLDDDAAKWTHALLCDLGDFLASNPTSRIGAVQVRFQPSLHVCRGMQLRTIRDILYSVPRFPGNVRIEIDGLPDDIEEWVKDIITRTTHQQNPWQQYWCVYDRLEAYISRRSTDMAEARRYRTLLHKTREALFEVYWWNQKAHDKVIQSLQEVECWLSARSPDASEGVVLNGQGS